MRIEYFPETDSLYIELTARPGADAREIDDGIVIDVDADGHLVGIDIDQASKHSSTPDATIRPTVPRSRDSSPATWKRSEPARAPCRPCGTKRSHRPRCGTALQPTAS